ncbi:InlB B-repeat-containing protein [Microbulbifer celer]|uniref:Bacterial repeat domain-containing protein n=1 Tax=Microbulbifer celer TaxID=435905 RepID=A0ABW3U9W9_9GAMM|nr:hypothetical protein [Microbulbifer celer]UFN57371.1 hypothetical protein LPW13_17665 [Microbulbifer celer]
MKGIICSVLAVVLLPGCGGGGEGNSPDDTPPDPPPAPVTYTITATVSEDISGEVEGTGEYNEGETAALTATPADWYRFVSWEEGQQEISTSPSLEFTVTEDRELFARFEEIPCEESDGTEAEIGYDWQSSSNQFTITNHNRCDGLFFWAILDTQFLDDPSRQEITPIYLSLSPGESRYMQTKTPEHSKPVLIYSRENGESFEFVNLEHLPDTENQHNPVALLDYEEDHVGQIEREDSQQIGSEWDSYGDCHNFSWLDMENGHYQVAPDPTEEDSFCEISIDDQQSQYPIMFRYYVTDKSQRPIE